MSLQGETVEKNMVLQAEGLRFAYPGCALLDGLTLAWSAGLALVQGGESSGKTTLLRLLAGELVPQAGHVRLQGVDQASAPSAYRAQVFWQDPRSTAR